MIDAAMADLERYLRARLASPLPGPAAQRRFAPVPMRDGWAPDLRPDEARQAAALLLIHPTPHGPAIPLTVRRTDLPHHPGQVSLPGGALDPGERPESAALREAEEEIGVVPEDIRILGALSTVWIAVSNFVVHPFVALADRTPGLLAHPDEVAALVEIRLADIRDHSRVRWARQRLGGVDFDYPYFAAGDHKVWGATAMILGEFASLFEN
jgi:8-oxo-dGTP pyrophosphatase MutT (NUDIX family)